MILGAAEGAAPIHEAEAWLVFASERPSITEEDCILFGGELAVVAETRLFDERKLFDEMRADFEADACVRS